MLKHERIHSHKNTNQSFMLTASMQKIMDYQKETHTNRRSRLISTLLVSISYIIILLTSCTTEHKSDQENLLRSVRHSTPIFLLPTNMQK